MESVCGAVLFGLVYGAAFSMGLQLLLGYQTWWIGPVVGFALGASGGMAVGSFFGVQVVRELAEDVVHRL